MSVPSPDSKPAPSVRGSLHFAPHPLWTLVAFGVIAATTHLSRWQFGRATEKAALQAQYESQRAAAPLSELSRLDTTKSRYARVKLVGHFLPSKTVLHDNQIVNKRAGIHVLSAFQPEDITQPPILVNRGWLALPADRSALRAPDTPTAKVTIEGQLNVPAARTKRLADGADTVLVKQTIELETLAMQFGVPLAPMIVEQTDIDPMFTREWPAPDFKINTHRMYAGQWACFAALTFLFWLKFSFRRSPA
jgi:cytochrome oxidase assembly protein ShyY1